MAFLDVFLGVVPSTAAGGHGDGDKQASHNRAHQHTAERLGACSRTHEGIDHDNHHDRYQYWKQ
jgi:hypothetical protein